MASTKNSPTNAMISEENPFAEHRYFLEQPQTKFREDVQRHLLVRWPTEKWCFDSKPKKPPFIQSHRQVVDHRSNGPMGIALSCGVGRFRFGKKDKQWFRIDPVILTKSEANEILGKDGQRPGTYLLYEDIEKERICLAFRTADGKVDHYSIVKLNDLFYFNDFPFPYLESIVLYYKKYKFKDTRLTHQAALSPYVKSQRSKRLSGYLRLDTVKEAERDSHA